MTVFKRGTYRVHEKTRQDRRGVGTWVQYQVRQGRGKIVYRSSFLEAAIQWVNEREALAQKIGESK